MQKKNKDYEIFQSKIKDLLKDFERNRQWADIGNWLSRAQPLISANKFPDFPHKINMGKRLAQCLNISLPAGVHSGALSVYNTILQNFENRSQLLPLMSIGLFPFFEYSSSNLKLQLLNIFQKHFTKDHQCVQMIVSLMNTLLTGLNQNNQELARKIYSLCDNISQKYGRTWVDGAVWVNILKSPKVRVAGFKYFMKSFKDRDKQLKNMKNQQMEKDEVEFIPNNEILQNSLIQATQGEKELLLNLLKMKEYEDDYRVRFPNFSSLVVSALSACLSITQTDNFARRAALDMMIFYLKLEKSEFMTEVDTIHLLKEMLHIIRLKEYSLTRRIYTYLFGQPDMEGCYHVNSEERKYQMEMFLKSLEVLLKIDDNSDSQIQEGTLTIIQTLLKDHEELGTIIIPPLAYKILIFLRNCNLPQKIIYDFYSKIIKSQKEVFISACLEEIIKEQQIKNSRLAYDNIKIIEYFYLFNLSSETDESHDVEINRTIQGLLKYMEITECKDLKNCQQIMELCKKLLTSSSNSQKCLSQSSIKTLDFLIQLKPRNSIYAGLLTIHPHPPKQSLLPYINQTSLSLVCITNLLSFPAQNMEHQQRKSLFFAIFNLLNCHVWEQMAIKFIANYKTLYKQEFQKYINEVEPTQWLIYWKKLNGDFDQGVIRMLKNLDNQNPLLKNISKKWIQGSKMFVGKIVDPIYAHITLNQPNSDQKKQQNIKEILPSITVYKMLQNIFNILKDEFVTYFFIQKQKYLLPLANHIYTCLESDDVQLKSQSISMLQFLLQKSNKLQEKLIFLQLTLNKTLKVLRDTFKEDEYLLEIQILSFFKSVAEIFSSFKGHKNKSNILKKLIQENQLFQILAEGMKQTKVSYVRTLYMQLLQYSSQTLASFCQDKKFISSSLTIVFEKLFIMLRENDVTYLEEIIRGKSASVSRRKKSDMGMNYEKMNNVTDTQFNVEVKYAQVIQLWGLVKFFVKISIDNKIHDLPFTQLLSLILQSFPFSYLKYDQLSTKIISQDYEVLQEQIRNVTGLKKQVLEIFETLWENYQQQIINYLIDKGDPRVLIHGNVDPNAVVKAIQKSKICKQVMNYNKYSNFSLPKSVLHYNTQILIAENQISYFFYLYLMYSNLSLVKQKKSNSFIHHLYNILKILKDSWHVQTKIWALEILYCICIRIPFRDIHMDVNKTKQEFQDLLRDILDELKHIIIKNKSFTHRSQIKTGIFNIFTKQQKESSLYDFIKIYPPTIYRLNEKFLQRSKSKNSDHVFHIQDEEEYFLFSKSINQPSAAFTEYLSIVTLKTFIQIYPLLLIYVFEQDLNKISQLIKDHLSIMIPLLSDKSPKNSTYIENTTELICKIFSTPSLKNQMIKLLRKSILDTAFNAEDFFKCTKKALKHWKYIIDVCSDGQDWLGQLLEEKLFQGIFTRKAEQTRMKIKNFQRVCFLIYAGRIDKYQNKLRTVLESLVQVMKQQNPSPALLILILFCIRILLIRLSQNTLNRIFKSIWPSLITLLIQVFTKQAFSKNWNLLLAGLKVIQLLHALELQEFNIHKWMFIFDYFGIRLDTQTEEEEKYHNQDKILTPFTFKPIMTQVLPENKLKCNFIPEPLKEVHYQAYKRKLVIKQSNVDTEEDVRNHGFILLQYMMDLNQKRVYTVKQQIEDLIEGDFISLDDYIFQLR